jgi:hypothetical protein
VWLVRMLGLFCGTVVCTATSVGYFRHRQGFARLLEESHISLHGSISRDRSELFPICNSGFFSMQSKEENSQIHIADIY